MTKPANKQTTDDQTSSSQQQQQPTQDMFYTFFLTRCAEHRIRKPNRWILDMLENFDHQKQPTGEKNKNTSSNDEVKKENNQQQLTVDQAKLLAIDSARFSEMKASREQHEIEVEPVPIHERKQTRHLEGKNQMKANPLLCPPVEKINFASKTEFIVPPPVILGNTTLAIIIEMFYFMPQLEVIDFSNCRLYDVDPIKMAPTGNEILKALLDLACIHPQLAHINLGRRSNQIGTEVGSWILRAAMENPRLIAVEFDERGIEKHILDDIFRTLKINRNTSSPISTVIRSIHPISPDLLKRMLSMSEIGINIDRKTSDERQMLLSLMYDRPKLFFSLLENGIDQTVFVSPTRQFLLSEALKPSFQGVRGDGKNLFIIASGTVIFRLGSHEITLSRGDVFGEDDAQISENGNILMYASGLLIRRSANGVIFAAPHSVCKPLFSSWEQRVKRFFPSLKKCNILNPLPVYLLARCCYDAELVNVSSSAAAQRIIKSGDHFNGFYVILRGNFIVRQHNHVARFLQTRENSRAMKEGGMLELSVGDLFGEEPLVNRRKSSSVDIDCVVALTTTNEEVAVGGGGGGGGGQLLLLDKTLCQNVLEPLLKTVLTLQARSYGAEWNDSNNKNVKNELNNINNAEQVEGN